MTGDRMHDTVHPNFFIVGAAKCGTTSMAHYLDQHPEVFMSQVKEPNYFNTDHRLAKGWMIRDKKRYLDLFRGATEAKMIGEASVWYLFSEVAAERIKFEYPNAKIIIMLRHPVDAMYSLHGQFLKTNNESIVNFAQALEAEADRRCGRGIPPGAHFPNALCYRQWADFATQVKRYINVLGRDKILFILFDDFKQDAEGVYKEVAHFLEIDSSFTPCFDKMNPAKELRYFYLGRLFKPVPWIPATLRAILPLTIRTKIGDLLATIFKSPNRPLKINPVIRSKLTRELHAQITALGSLIRRDLSDWVGTAKTAALSDNPNNTRDKI